MNIEELDNMPAMPESRKLADMAMLRHALGADLQPRRRWGPRSAVIGLAVAGLVGAGAVATATVIHRPTTASVTDSGRCYSMVSSDFTDAFPGTSVANATSPDGTTQPVPGVLIDECATLWRDGVLVAGVHDAQSGSDNLHYPVPALTACVLPSGQAAVFPGPADVCSNLSLSRLAH